MFINKATLEGWVVDNGYAIPPSDWSQAPLLKDYHPNGDVDRKSVV